ncbi:MAG: hypothetical protein WAV73_04040 [Candidatus Moraniibacteriota bacterium]
MNNQGKTSWLSLSVFGKDVYLFFVKDDLKSGPIEILKSSNGIDFSHVNQRMIFKNKIFGLGNKFDIEKGFKISKIKDGYFLSYQKLGKILGAISQDGLCWKKIGITENIKNCGLVIETSVPSEEYLMFFGERQVRVATSSDLVRWDIKRSAFLHTRDGYFDSQSLSVVSVFSSQEGMVLLYTAIDTAYKLSLGAAIIDKTDYRKILWRSKRPIWTQPREWKGGEINFVGSYYQGKRLLVYWDFCGELKAVSIANTWTVSSRAKSAKKKIPKLQKLPKLPKALKLQEFSSQLELAKHENNPIIGPIEEHAWESRETFNPAAVYLKGKVHLLYRALGEKGISVLGYAASEDGINIDERLKKPVYAPMQPFEYGGTKKANHCYPYSSGGSWSGCEDPRLSVIGRRIYMTYVAFNGSCPPGVALTSISVKDFLAKNWNWKIPKLISKPGEIQKNWVVFPEKINGKFAILHSISPSVSIDYFDSLDDKKITIESYHNNKSDDTRWDNILRGVGSPPIKTDYGWLVFYHAMDRRDPNRYKVGAMILDYQNPEKILHRSSQPILEPVEKYENEGSKSGVVYVCGSIVKDEKIYVYYGGADRFTCVATASVQEFLLALINSSKTTPFIRLAVA